MESRHSRYSRRLAAQPANRGTMVKPHPNPPITVSSPPAQRMPLEWPSCRVRHLRSSFSSSVWASSASRPLATTRATCLDTSGSSWAKCTVADLGGAALAGAGLPATIARMNVTDPARRSCARPGRPLRKANMPPGRCKPRAGRGTRRGSEAAPGGPSALVHLRSAPGGLGRARSSALYGPASGWTPASL